MDETRRAPFDPELARGAEDGPGVKADELARAVIGAAIKVHRHLGPGFIEAVYEDALCIEMDMRGIPYSRQSEIGITYKGHRVGTGRMDLIVGGLVIVELKAVDRLAPIFTAQTISYLRATGLRLALLINFNVQLLKDGIKRIVL